MKRNLLITSVALGALAAACASSGRSDSVAEASGAAPAALPAGASLTIWTLEAEGAG